VEIRDYPMCHDHSDSKKLQLLEDIRVFESLLTDLSELSDEERAWGIWALNRELEVKRQELESLEAPMFSQQEACS
jgi:hypothetical protein